MSYPSKTSIKPLTTSEAAAVANNLFPSARPLLAERPQFPWHRDQAGRVSAAQPNSSQALAIDVLWTVRSLQDRNHILDEWCRWLGLPFEGSWTLELEERLSRELLGEPRPTQLDATARSEAGLLVLECKFTEADAGACSQTQTPSR